ncbi:hypothetical protein GMDG_00760 [Pseudogymnoascus destructans 20631-21]|uniref:Uncharacterized protein n=1 Tax=Pseudogymnoascus destructans (strain ATCC MYA-4855 / 20631-21) TaxID=658429 RepID=L8GA86_PSED2|nr:hypothetical protein GMDG_00760 [Pseudogymnoascus destructans 20631-21]
MDTLSLTRGYFSRRLFHLQRVYRGFESCSRRSKLDLLYGGVCFLSLKLLLSCRCCHRWTPPTTAAAVTPAGAIHTDHAAGPCPDGLYCPEKKSKGCLDGYVEDAGHWNGQRSCPLCEISYPFRGATLTNRGKGRLDPEYCTER